MSSHIASGVGWYQSQFLEEARSTLVRPDVMKWYYIFCPALEQWRSKLTLNRRIAFTASLVSTVKRWYIPAGSTIKSPADKYNRIHESVGCSEKVGSGLGSTRQDIQPSHTPNIKVARPIHDIPNFFVFMHMPTSRSQFRALTNAHQWAPNVLVVKDFHSLFILIA